MILASILSIVRAIRLVPRHRVQRAISPLRDVILRQHIRVEKVTGIVSAIGARMTCVVAGSSLARSGALARVVGVGEEFHADVGVFTVGERGVDGTTEFERAGEVGLRFGRGVFGVTVGAGDDDLEVGAVLALVYG